MLFSKINDLMKKDLDMAYSTYVLPNISPEREINVYRRFGVEIFRTILMNACVLERNKETNYLIGKPTIKNLKRFAIETVKNEQTHLMPAIFSSLVTIGTLLGNSPILTATASIATLAHTYPIMLQKYNRKRIHDIIQRRELKSSRNSLERCLNPSFSS